MMQRTAPPPTALAWYDEETRQRARVVRVICSWGGGLHAARKFLANHVKNDVRKAKQRRATGPAGYARRRQLLPELPVKETNEVVKCTRS